MLRTLGLKRVAALAILLGLNAFLAIAIFTIVMPDRVMAEGKLKTLRGNTATLQGDVERMQIEFEQLKEQQSTFDELKKQGFFSNQSRRPAEIIFQKIQGQSGVNTAIVNIQGGTTEPNDEAQKAGYQILKSPVSIKIQAMDDVDIFRYLYLVEQYFPGHVSVSSLKLERKSDITGTILRSISGGLSPALVEAEVSLIWTTMIPDTDVISPPEGGPT